MNDECRTAYGACSTNQQNLKNLHELSGRFYGVYTKADRAEASRLRRMEATSEYEQAKAQRIEGRIQKALQGYDGADPVVIISEITHLLRHG